MICLFAHLAIQPWHSINEAPASLLVSWTSCRQYTPKMAQIYQLSHTPWYVSHRHLMSSKGEDLPPKAATHDSTGWELALKIVTPNTFKGKKGNIKKLLLPYFDLCFLSWRLLLLCFEHHYVDAASLWNSKGKTLRTSFFQRTLRSSPNPEGGGVFTKRWVKGRWTMKLVGWGWSWLVGQKVFKQIFFYFRMDSPTFFWQNRLVT